MGLIAIPGGWWEFEGEEPPGLVFMLPDEGGDPDTVRALLRVVDSPDSPDCADRQEQ